MVKVARPLPPELLPQLSIRHLDAIEPRLNLEHSEISGLDLSRQTLQRSDVSGVRLNSPVLSSARIQQSSWLNVEVLTAEGAGLYGDSCVLTRILFERSRLTGLILSGSQLTDVSFTGCKLDLANIRAAHLKRVRFERCELMGADFSSANLSDVSFEHCNLTGIDVTNMTSKSVDMRGCEVLSPKGIGGLRGVTLTSLQLLSLTPWLAQELGIKIEDE